MIGKKIKELRKKANYTQEELACKLDVSRQAITKWETNAGLPDIENVKALANLFDVSIDSLLENAVAEEKDYIYKSTTEYDICDITRFEFNLGYAKEVYVTSSDCEKIKVILASNSIDNLSQALKTKIDDTKKRLDINIINKKIISNKEASEELYVEVILPLNLTARAEIHSKCNNLVFAKLNGNVEFDANAYEVKINECNAHIELDINNNVNIYVDDKTIGKIDVNQINGISKLITNNKNFKTVKKGIRNNILCYSDVENKGLDLTIELNGINSELTISK